MAKTNILSVEAISQSVNSAGTARIWSRWNKGWLIHLSKQSSRLFKKQAKKANRELQMYAAIVLLLLYHNWVNCQHTLETAVVKTETT